MANKEALRDLQTRLAERMREARTEHRAATWLAVESAGVGFLLPLVEAGEIFPLGVVLPVPHTAAWFVGVANLRGGLHGVVDLAGFLGLRRAPVSGAPEGAREQTRVVAFGAALETNCALLFERLSGLRGREQMTALPRGAQALPAFVGGQYRDEAGRVWLELNLAALAGDEAFLKIMV
ncbi:chemotaxis protein CheW [Caldimonas tepidiphila]|uniref:chemotaxis protein CheW n=1 Tax=Caldimonas tepidiphila TaxID=2315841 RepID=UPI000E5B4D5E|nr:chemotaxis protein CheW [Caldimonas tepidiphila]